MSSVKDLRTSVEMTQAELADSAGTSQPTIAAYEAGRKSPTLRTLERLAHSAGRDMIITFVPTMTREERRSLFLHRAIANKLECSPEDVLSKVRRNLDKMLAQHPEAGALLKEWTLILDRSVGEIVDVLADPRSHARELRHVTPFAGVLTNNERARAYREFRKTEADK